MDTKVKLEKSPYGINAAILEDQYLSQVKDHIAVIEREERHGVAFNAMCDKIRSCRKKKSKKAIRHILRKYN